MKSLFFICLCNLICNKASDFKVHIFTINKLLTSMQISSMLANLLVILKPGDGGLGY